LLILTKVVAQEQKPVEPPTVGDIYYIDSASQSLKLLTTEIGTDKMKSGGHFASGKVIFYVFVKGEHSSFRIKSTDKMEFAFSLGKPESVELYKAVIHCKQRETDYEQAKGVGYTLGERTPIPGLSIAVSKLGQGSYKFTPRQPLEPGEYFIFTGKDLFTFGVD
jgi:hypothetical protein